MIWEYVIATERFWCWGLLLQLVEKDPRLRSRLENLSLLDILDDSTRRPMCTISSYLQYNREHCETRFYAQPLRLILSLANCGASCPTRRGRSSDYMQIHDDRD